MRSSFRSAVPAPAILAAITLPAEAQHAHAQHASTVIADLRADVEEVERKMLGLARAIPEDKYSWRPAAGVRSIGDVFLHVAADNYLIPAALGFPADASTGIKGDDYKTALAFEKRTMNKAATIAELEKSFAHLKKTLSDTPDARLTQAVSMFGMNLTGQKAWIMATTHLHEHLGQMIAYARSNGIAPPWS
jgi:uncharacterized damage-inducible protein DinB